MSEEKTAIKETTIRMDQDLADRLSIVAQVKDMSMNQLMVQAIKESIMLYEGDPEYQNQRQTWFEKLRGMAGA